MAHGHKFTDLVHHGVFIVVIIAVLIVIVERSLPLAEPVTVNDLPDNLRTWHDQGKYVSVFGRNMFTLQRGNGDEAVILVHGFPTSSYDYHRALDQLEKDVGSDKRIFLFDHVGFGFSDKPSTDYEYTLHDHAENALELWRMSGIKKAHIVAHDMGDSVVTEILTRYQQKLLPEHFNTFFKSVTFTNGGMHYDMINFRMSQRLLNMPYLGPFLSSLSSKMPKPMMDRASKQQFVSIWGPTTEESEIEERDKDIMAMSMLTRFNGGNSLAYKTISYLKDRARFETRWYASLRQLEIPIMLFWGDSDAVSPVDIPKYLATEVFPSKLVTGKYLKETGHFLMLEKPKEWASIVSEFVKKA